MHIRGEAKAGFPGETNFRGFEMSVKCQRIAIGYFLLPTANFYICILGCRPVCEEENELQPERSEELHNPGHVQPTQR